MNNKHKEIKEKIHEIPCQRCYAPVVVVFSYDGDILCMDCMKALNDRKVLDNEQYIPIIYDVS